MYRLTVIITTYNRQHLLPRAIESVQEEKDIEVIVVDDASTDGTQEYCQSIPWIKYIRQKTNQGTAAARNAGLSVSHAPFIAFLDDDDRRLPGTFEQQLSFFDKAGDCGLVHGRVLYADQHNELTGDSTLGQDIPQGDVLIELLKKNFITLSSVVVRKDCFDKLGGFDTSADMLGLEDWDMWLRIAGPYKISCVPIAVAVYRRPEKGSGQWYSDIGRQFFLAAKAYNRKWLHLPGIKEKLGIDYQRMKQQVLGRASDIMIYSALNHSPDFWEKCRRLKQALVSRPTNLFKLNYYKAVVKAILNQR
jgi:glycosyltransferase involved in cell wall biosynthesis